MQKWYGLAGLLCLLTACAPDKDSFIQPSDASQVISVSDVISASNVENVPNLPAINASAASVPSNENIGVASSAAASSASTPVVPEAVKKGKKIPIGGSAEFGNTVYYFPSSMKKVGKLWHVLTENHFDKVQKLPDSGKAFQYSLITEAVDCQRRLTDPISVVHYSTQNEKVESHTFSYPDYSTWTELELQSLADEHPDSAFIAAVCQTVKK